MVINNEAIKNILIVERDLKNIRNSPNLCKNLSCGNYRNNIIKYEKINGLLFFFFYIMLLSNFSLYKCQNRKHVSYDFSTQELEFKLSQLQNHSLILFNQSYTNIAETNYTSLKLRIQDLCSSLKNKLIETNHNYTLIKSIFPSFIEGIRSVFGNILNATNNFASTNITITHTIDYFDWLKIDNAYISSTNVTQIDDIYLYTIANLYLIFPVFTIVLFGFFGAAIFNCLYCNFCYCCAFRYTTKVRNKQFFHKITIALIIFGCVFIGLFFILFQRVSKMKDYHDYLTCELLNKEVLTLITNQDFAKESDKEEKDSKGLIRLRDDLNNNFISELNKVKIAVNKLNSISEENLLQKEMDYINNGINTFKNYVDNNTFAFPDLNLNYFQSTLGIDLIYKCMRCKSLINQVEKITQNVYNVYYKNWSDSLKSINFIIYNEIKNDTKWTNIMNYHNTLILYINRLIFFGQKYAENILTQSDEMYSIFDSYSIISFVLFAFTLIIVNLGIYFYYSSYEQKVAQGSRINQDSLEKNSNNLDINKFTNNLLQKSVFLKSWDRRKLFHLVINFSIATVIFANYMAYYLMLYSLYTYDLINYIESNFHSNNELYKFKYHPYGSFVDQCNKYNNTNPKILFDYIGMNVTKNFWFQNMDALITLSNARLDKTVDEFDNLNSEINSMDLSEFVYVDPDDIKINITWDIVNEEQLNFFLFKMKSYTKMNISDKIAKHKTLQYYTDYNYINDNVKVTQRKICTPSYTEDVYTSSEEICKKYFDSYAYKNEITLASNSGNPKTCFKLTMNPNKCSDTDSDCFANGILSRYNSDEIFSNCDLNREDLDSSGFNTTQLFFRDEIFKFAKMAKNEFILKSNLEKKLDEYKSLFTYNIKDKVDTYIAKLNTTTNELLNLKTIIVNIVRNFENSYNLKETLSTDAVYESYLNCSKITIIYLI